MPCPVEEKYVAECEVNLGSTLPISYRTAMIAEDGGEVICDNDTWKLHPICDNSDKKRFKRTANDVVCETKAMRSWTGWPDTAICIAENGTGDALVLLSNDRDCEPAVHRWSHETGLTTKMQHDFSELQKA
ncbi:MULTISPECIES: SMI1/KNR4 family protein [unclassified Pseudovibrio]|uniref:SMI1/KNR4 family protein n=1 Tax=unclassified Pseudovibrio TaxID=2627060 RepID=UPI0007AE48CF|nr:MULTISPECIES: SMI1/KNR4 family protein [unclassified Pseudovibrio]KZL02202.1 SMI1 / KNR4 family protein [Pseudovibrio sp. W74]KZL08252.1 SMI1 / KNR4 family protein [Pseudovibrio sp. Ad14]